MSLQSLLQYLDSREINMVYVYFKDEQGHIQNIYYQDHVFFYLDNEKKGIHFINPIRAADKLKDVRAKKYEIVGFGSYAKPVDLTKDYLKKGERRSWRM